MFLLGLLLKLSEVGLFYENMHRAYAEYDLLGYHFRKTILEHDFHHPFGSCFLHQFRPGSGLENGSILGGFGHQFSSFFGIIFEIIFEGDFRAKGAPHVK